MCEYFASPVDILSIWVQDKIPQNSLVNVLLRISLLRKVSVVGVKEKCRLFEGKIVEKY